VPVTGKPVIPADNGVTGEYRYRPVLRVPIPIFRERHAVVMHVGSRVTITISEIMNKRIENIVSPYITQHKSNALHAL
jgi:RIO-like serine/threonine protein kinase